MTRAIAALLVAVALVVPFDSQRPLLAQGKSEGRLVAVGDIHGSIEGIRDVLKKAGIADASGAWTGGRDTFVQTGDFTDRGEHVRAVLDLLMTLEAQAKDAGGRAVSLLGNHEVMNLIGDTRDANPPIFATFADPQSATRQSAGWDAYRTLIAARKARGAAVPTGLAQTREAFNAAHPIGYIEYREALGPGGKYGVWLRGKAMVANVNGSIFMHAGIPPTGAPQKIDQLNDKVRDEVRRMDRYVQRLVDKKLALPFFTLGEIIQVSSAEIASANQVIADAKASGKDVDPLNLDLSLLAEAGEILKIDKWLSLDADGALWWRGLSTLPDDSAGGPLVSLLARYGAQRFVTGHTPTADRRIHVRFGGRAILIDTGMNTAFYHGRWSALEIIGDQLTAIYDDGRVPLSATRAAAVNERRN